MLNTEYNLRKNSSWYQSGEEGIMFPILLIPQHFLSGMFLMTAQLVFLENRTVSIIIKLKMGFLCAIII